MQLRCAMALLRRCRVFLLLVGVAIAQREWYVSCTNGRDNPNCSAWTSPCRTLRYTVDLAHNGDFIYLDGQGSKDHPYGCEKPTGLRERTGGGFISKSLSVIGLHTRAYLSCDHGLHFSSPGTDKVLNVSLNNLAFSGSGTSFFGNWSVSVFNCTFSDCFSPLNMTGTIMTLFLEISVFENNTNCMTILKTYYWHKIGVVTVDISGVVFKNNHIQPIKSQEGMVFVNNARGLTFIQIRNTLFQENYSRKPAYAIEVKSDTQRGGCLRIQNSSFVSTSNGVLVNGSLDMQISNSTFVSNGRALHLILKSVMKEPSFVTLENLLFSNNSAGFLLEFSVQGAANVTVEIKSCLFNESVHQESTQLPAVEFQEKSKNNANISYEILITNVSFSSIRGSALFLSDFTRERKLNMKIEDSLFIDNENTYFYARTGYIVYMVVNGEDEYPCQSNKMAGQVQFRNTHFTGNNASFGIVFLTNVDASFFNCSFTKNYFLAAEGALIDHGEGRGNLNITNGLFLQPRNPPRNSTSKIRMNRWPIFISSMNKGNLVIKESIFVASETYSFYPVITASKEDSVKLYPSTVIQCPVGTVLTFVYWPRAQRIFINGKHCIKNVTTLKVFCNSCPIRTYSLQNGRSAGLKTNQSECQPCPYGATCLDGIKAKPNFWGYEKRPSILTFVPCPLEYCHPQNTSNVSDYNGCFGHRNGILCGACKHMYSEELFSTKCRVESECQDRWFWVFTASYSIALVLLLMFRQRFLSFLWRQTFWFRRPASEAIQLQETHFDEGYLKITFYFYQIAELLVLKGPEHLLYKVNILSAWFNLFNFELQYFSEEVGCPFPGLTAVTKELFMCSRVFTTMACSVVLFLIHKVFTKICGLKKLSLTFYLAVLMEILLLGYERLADTALSLLHCVPIGSELRLFLDGNEQCWQWWQIGLMAYIVVFVAPFILVLYFGSLSLYRNKVSAKEFLGACVLPLPFLVRWAVQHVRGNNTMQQDSSSGEEIKETLYEPFRTPTKEDNGTVYWESVLIGRRFLLLCLHSFIADPMFRLMSLDCACVLILLHHVSKRPYHNTSANVCETVSLLALVVIATFNLAEAVLMSAGVEAAGPNEVGLEALEWVEVALLGFLPVALCVLGTFSFFSQLCRLITAIIRGSKKIFGIREYSGFSCAEQKRPLLDATSSGYS